ncbi:unnamed protein product [Effrenium voratum]|uniref:NADH:ubiquinone oxidoreductase intermediate-associated protein 30 domain-containing protein n=1 Tax=Effrenium voratum TaxID=2562239 RepID=A0AA36NJM5_9DINO|nr:unnamed protein product [Effrenium voratum]
MCLARQGRRASHRGHQKAYLQDFHPGCRPLWACHRPAFHLAWAQMPSQNLKAPEAQELATEYEMGWLPGDKCSAAACEESAKVLSMFCPHMGKVDEVPGALKADWDSRRVAAASGCLLRCFGFCVCSQQSGAEPQDSSSGRSRAAPLGWLQSFAHRRAAAFFGALPNPLSVFEQSGPGTAKAITPDTTVWSAENPLGLVWGPLDDVVMGGASQSKLQGTSWRGNVITEGGGFAGIRSQPIKPALDVSQCTGLKIRVKGGDGQRFKLIIRDSYDWNGIAWSYEFDTRSLLPSMDGVIEASAPFSELVPTLFARSVSDQVFNKAQLTAVQITLSKFGYDGALNPNFKAGEFTLDIESIKTF